MKTRSMRLSPNERGFTLVELMVALAIATFFIAATMTIVDLSTKSYRAQERVSDAQQGLRAGMDTMVHRIRMAGYDPLAESSGAIAVNGIQTAMTTKIQVMADYNADGAINAADFEEITYQYNSATQQVTQLLYESAAIAENTPQVLVENVSGLTFTYLDDKGHSTATLSKIVTVVVQMIVSDRNRETGETFKRTLTTRINCRNLRL